MSNVAGHPLAAGPRQRDGRRFVAVAYTLGLVLAGANLPTPLWPTYERIDRFGAGTLTAVFVVYVVTVAGALMVAGQLSDRIGRRRVLVPSVVVAMAGGAAFAASPGVVALVVGRALSGLASGALTAVAPAALVDLEPTGNARRASGVASAVTVFGLAAGPLASALTVRLAPGPTRTVYLLYLAALAPAAVALVSWAEPRRRVRPAHLAVPTVPRELRQLFTRTAAQFSAGWTGTAMFFALGPTLATRVFGDPRLVATAAGIFAVFVVSGAAQLATRRRPAAGFDRAGLVLLVVGLSLLPAAVATGSLPALAVGGLLAGAGQGLTHRASQQELLAASPPAQRGQVTAAYYLAGYASIAVLLVMLGQLTSHVGLTVGLAVFVALIDIAALGALLTARPGTVA